MRNILFFTRVDRVALISEIRKYIEENCLNCKVVILSDNMYCPSQHFADEFILLPSKNNKYISEFLKDIIIKNQIKGLFVASNFDIEFILEIEKWLINKGIVYFAPIRKTLKICISKKKIFKFLSQNKILTPCIYDYSYLLKKIDIKNLKYPLVLKPDIGQGSYNVHTIHNFDEFQYFYRRIEKPIIQQYISGEHYTIDCFNNLKKQLKIYVPRKRLVVERSHSSVSELINDEVIKELAFSLSNKLFITGMWNFQLIKNADGYFIYDINPRLASGLIYSIVSGIYFQKYIVDSLLGRNISNWDYIIPNGNVISEYKSYKTI